MKLLNVRFVPIVLIFFLLLTLSCTKEDDDNTTVKIQDQIQTNVQKGNWRITQFVDSGENEIENYIGYDFTFSSSGVLTTTNGTDSYAGTWSISDKDNNDDSIDDLHFNIQFDLNNDFEELSDDWDIISQSPDKIQLIDISGGNGDTDYLTFNKN